MPCIWGWNSELPEGSMWLALIDAHRDCGSAAITARA